MPYRDFLQNEYIPQTRGRSDQFDQLRDDYLQPRQKGFMDYALPIGSALAALVGSGSSGKTANVLGMLSGLTGGAYQGMNDAYQQNQDHAYQTGLQGMDVNRSVLGDLMGAQQGLYGIGRDEVADQRWQQGYDMDREVAEAKEAYYNRGNQPEPQTPPEPQIYVQGLGPIKIGEFLKLPTSMQQQAQQYNIGLQNEQIQGQNESNYGRGGMQGPGVEGFGSPPPMPMIPVPEYGSGNPDWWTQKQVEIMNNPNLLPEEKEQAIMTLQQMQGGGNNYEPAPSGESQAGWGAIEQMLQQFSPEEQQYIMQAAGMR